ncbi:hypothetical protein L0B52_03135 [Suttonella sp. R2A3]|uniref:hypothetical protein n=1 Tax=Suttonella sp. R2A3 TaxID=2908648 RepID=UPI001F41C228|nr:hypothetical protein [Suttonella sp. R2A3]UJF25156.1 hypothetical protein L0B52_03135 [Suttonella sp. R2A3]
MAGEVQWFCVNLGDALMAQSMLYELEKTLNECYQASGQPETMFAAFRHESHDLHCHIKLYLTNDLQQAAQLDNARRCPQPSEDDVSYLSGNRNFWLD